MGYARNGQRAQELFGRPSGHRAARAHPAVQPRLEASAALGPEDHIDYLDELNKRERLGTALLGVMARADLDALTYPTIRRQVEGR